MADIVLSDVCCGFVSGGRWLSVLDGVSLHVPKGRLVAVVGRSGCGKTTLLRIVAGLLQPASGRVGYSSPTPRVGLVFQEPRLLPWKSVRDNLRLALLSAATPEADVAVDAALECVGLRDWAMAMPAELSGGMAQRVGLARALCRRPEVLLLDEPFGALDALTRTQLHGELQRIRGERPLTTILVTHDISEAVLLADEVLHLYQGSIAGRFAVDLPHPRRLGDPALAPRVEAVFASVMAYDS